MAAVQLAVAPTMTSMVATAPAMQFMYTTPMIFVQAPTMTSLYSTPRASMYMPAQTVVAAPQVVEPVAALPAPTVVDGGFGRKVFNIRYGNNTVTCVYYPAADEDDNGGLGSRGVIVTAGGNNGDVGSIMPQQHMSPENRQRFVRGQRLSGITFGEAGPDFLYSKLGNEVPQRYGIAVLSVIFRVSGQVGGVEQQTHDLLAALSWINTTATDNPPPVVLMGWSMGGASVVQSAGQWAQQEFPLKIQHVLTIAGQPLLDNGRSSGAAHLPEGCGITICHGTGDDCMSCSQCTDMLQSDAAQGLARNAGITVKKFPGEHHGISSMYNWLMQGRLPVGMTPTHSGRPLVEDLFALTGDVA